MSDKIYWTQNKIRIGSSDVCTYTCVHAHTCLHMPAAYGRGRMPLLLLCDDSQHKKALYNKRQAKPLGKDAVVMLIPWENWFCYFWFCIPSTQAKRGWLWLICKVTAAWLGVLSATKVSLKTHPSIYLLDKNVHSYLMVDRSLFILGRN